MRNYRPKQKRRSYSKKNSRYILAQRGGIRLS